jgi:CheY-like chemotaxis protein
MSIRVLVVDDMASMRTMTKLSLKKIFTDVIIEEATNGIKAQEKLTSGSHFDIILCDWEMPDMNGAQFLKWLRAKPQFKDTPFIMVTAKSDQKFIENAIAAGVNDYITKPFSIDLLSKKVNLVLDEAKKKTPATPDFIGLAVINSGADTSNARVISFGLHDIHVAFESGSYIPHILEEVNVTLSLGDAVKVEGINGFVVSLELSAPTIVNSYIKGGIKFVDLTPKDMDGLIKFSNFLKK